MINHLIMCQCYYDYFTFLEQFQGSRIPVVSYAAILMVVIQSSKKNGCVGD